jgi:hypothetical protein
VVWAVSLSTTKLSPRRLTRTPLPAGIRSLVGVGNQHLAPSPSSALPPAAFACGCTSMHFGENQLSPRSVGISPLSTAHPPVLQHWWVRASTTCHSRFTLAMDSSRGFGSHRRYRSRPLQTRFPYGSPPLPAVTQATTMLSPDHSTKGTPSALAPTSGEWPLTACGSTVSGPLSSPLRGAFHLSLTVLVRYRSLKVFSLGGWSPLLPTNSPGFVVLRIPARRFRLPLRDSHPLRWCLPAPSRRLRLPPAGPTTPADLAIGWFGLFPSRSPLLRESRLISLRRATEMFQFARCPPCCLCIQQPVPGHHTGRVAPFGFSGLIARMQLPLNVSPVSASFVGLQRLGIPREPCLACSAPLPLPHVLSLLRFLPSAKLK